MRAKRNRRPSFLAAIATTVIGSLVLGGAGAGLDLGLVISKASAAPPHSDKPADRAYELFDKSVVSYRAGRFDEAATLLREAYALSPSPVLLYNLARALEGNGELVAAIDAYRRYLKTPEKLVDRPALERRVATLEQAFREREALRVDREHADVSRVQAEEKLARERAEAEAALAKAHADAEQRVAAARAGREERPPSRARVAAPWIVAGVGALGLGAGGALAGIGKSRHEAALADPVALSATDTQAGAQRLVLGANVAFGVGGAVVLAGSIWGIVDAVRAKRIARARRSERPVARVDLAR